jgi:hypothetical protein
LVYLGANIPLLYALFSVHGRDGLAALWGYSPHQYLFCLTVFPFAAFSAFTALHILIDKLGREVPDDFLPKVFLDNWIPLLLVGISLSALLTAADYYGSARSLDKLTPEYALMGVQYIKAINDELQTVKRSERDDARDTLVLSARKSALSISFPEHVTPAEVHQMIREAPPQVALQVMMNPKLQRRLGLLDPTLHPLSVFQVFICIFVGFCGLLAVGICVLGSHELEPSSKYPALHAALNATFYTVFSFGIYALCYQQYRSELEAVTGSGGTTLQQFFVGALVVFALTVLTAVDPSKGALPGVLFIRCLPILVMLLGFGAELKGPQVLRPLIGAETTAGIQVILISVFGLIACFTAFQVWPRRL